MSSINQGPITSKEKWKKETHEKLNMRSLTFKDLVIIKRFLEKGKREALFTTEELFSVDIVMAKLTNLIDDVIQKQQAK